jgi:uncharacterized phage protein gp47/JayE
MYIRPTLSDLLNQVAQDQAAALPGSDGLLRFSNLSVLGRVQAALAHLHYGYLDYIAREAVPFTATGENLQAWGALKNVTQKPATSATGIVTLPSTSGASLPAGSVITRGDGVLYLSTQDVTATGSTIAVPAQAQADPSGLTGAFGNCAVGTAMTLSVPVDGITSSGTVTTAFTGGADIETPDALRGRIMAAFQTTPQGGAKSDYVTWALQVPGVTRAWAVPNGFGTGTVVVFVMFDNAESANGGFPVGSDGVSANDPGPGGVPRGTVASGDQLTVANYLVSLQPVTALVYVVSPVANPVPFTIKGIPAAAQSAVRGAISNVFLRNGAPGGSIKIANVWSAIAAVSGVDDFVIVSPAADIANPAGRLPTLGAVTWQS